MASTAWSSTPSNLPAASRIYDFVVATTQDSISANLDLYVSENLSSQDPTEILYAYDASNNPAPISLTDFLVQSKGVNPFNVPSGTPLTDSRVKALIDAGFAFGIQAQIGIPRVPPSITLPSWVDFSNGSSSYVIFNMMCSTFIACEVTYGPRGPSAWTSFSQTPSQLAIFQAAVNLDFTSQPINPSSEVYVKLPENVRKMIVNAGDGDFSLQQLLYDLTSPGLISTFDLPGFDKSSDTYTLIKSKFLTFYFGQMKAAGTPLLGASITVNSAPAWTLQPTSLNFEVDLYLNGDGTVSTDPKTRGLATLNYLCLTGGKPQLPPNHFDWNWVAQSEEISFDGVVSINFDSVVNYFQNQLLSYVESNCFDVTVNLVNMGTQLNYSYTMTPGQTPTITLQKGNPDGIPVLSFDWRSSSSDQSGPGGSLGKMTLTQTYHLAMQFIGATIVVTQTQVVSTVLSQNGRTGSGNIINRSIVDTFTLGVTVQGQLTADRATTNTNNDMNPSSNPFVGWFYPINDIISGVENYINSFTSYSMNEVPLSIIQNFVLPGGKPFSFYDVGFAKPSLDLVAKIKYVDTGAS